MRRVAIVGSRSLLPSGFVANVILDELIALLGDDVDILLRKPKHGPARPFESLVAELAATLGYAVTWFAPHGEGGRVATFGRDVELVARSDEVIAFFPDGEEMTGGTGHVVEKALDQECPVRAYAVGDGTVRWVGGNEEPPVDPDSSRRATADLR